MKKIIFIIITCTLLAPSIVLGTNSSNLRYGAWLPFWKKQQGATEVALQLEKFNEISPFSYEVKYNGTLKDSLKITEGFWPDWISAVRDSGVKVIPTVALLDGDSIYRLLSNKKLRVKHEDYITAMVTGHKFDGVDIDYEDKSAKTEPYFSKFILGLASRLHAKNKTLSCTIEARTPPSSQFAVIPPDLAYANNYYAIGKYCDEVRIMAYDQGTIDLKLNATKGTGDLYFPVADPDWVEKVLNQTLKTISRKKIMLGIPTYGYESEVSWNGNVTTYKRLRSMTYQRAWDIASTTGAIPTRNSAGELSYAYASSTPISVSPRLTYIIPSTTIPLAIASTASTSVTRYVDFTDAAAIQKKIKLAQKYGLRGVIFFKMDGETDPALWDLIK